MLHKTNRYSCLLVCPSVIFCSAVNLVAYATELGPLFAAVLNACGQPALLCVLGNHLLIHLKEAGEAGMNEGTSYKPKVSSIDFGSDTVASGI